MILRDYQQSIYKQITAQSSDCVFQLDTGGGKTPIIAKLNDKPTINIAHRNMLIEQISHTLSDIGVNHQIIGNSQITKRCQLYQRNKGVEYAGHSYVGTIQSLISRYKMGRLNLDFDLDWQIIIDETHHVADGNMWAKLGEIFPNARFIGATATPCRLDGQGLHKDCGGLYDTLIQAEQLKDNATLWLIANGYLADYDAYCPPTIDMWDLVGKHKINSLTKDFSKKDMEQWARERINKKVAGDVIKHYRKLADGKTTLVFCPTIDVADQLSQVFKNTGIVSTYIASSLSFVENMRRVDAFRRGEVQVLCNVEMATEGFDLPSAECLIILRPTASFVLHRQMIGRVLRPKPNGQKAIIIDHVGNILNRGLPDDKVEWSLYGTPKNHTEYKIPCEICDFIHNPNLKNCPNCGAKNWLRSSQQEAEGAMAVSIGMIDVELVRKLRLKIFEQDRLELAKIEEKKRQERLANEIVVDYRFHQYSDSAIGNLCTKLSHWFIENIKDTNMAISDINKLTTNVFINQDFWVSNFNIKDLKTHNPKKCEKVLKKWLESH